MSSGGLRSRSGPLPQESSGRSDKRGYRLEELPAAGHEGPVPNFSLPEATPRELEVWAELWRLPQACAWSRPSESWRVGTVELYVRQRVKCEATDIGASHLAQLHRFADQVGLTDSGLAAMGYKVVADVEDSIRSGRRASSRDRLQVVTPQGALARARAQSEGIS